MFELVQHTADVRLRVAAASLEELFRDAVRGLYALMRGSADPESMPVTRTIAVDESADTTALLVDFLNEVLHRAHVGYELFESVTFTRFTGDSLTAELSGIAPASFEEDVKAVTYHEAGLTKDDGQWTTMLVMDI